MTAIQTLMLARPFGILRDGDIDNVIKLAPNTRLVVRTGFSRFTCPAECLPHLGRCLKAGHDYVKDVSFHPKDVRDAIERLRSNDAMRKAVMTAC